MQSFDWTIEEAFIGSCALRHRNEGALLSFCLSNHITQPLSALSLRFLFTQHSRTKVWRQSEAVVVHNHTNQGWSIRRIAIYIHCPNNPSESTALFEILLPVHENAIPVLARSDAASIIVRSNPQELMLLKRYGGLNETPEDSTRSRPAAWAAGLQERNISQLRGGVDH